MQKHEDGGKPADARKRRAYEPPKVVETGEFETLALACGKLVGTPTFACGTNPSES